MDLLVLMFLSGFALATLIFWPLLHKAHQRLAETGVTEPDTPRGKHALRTPSPTVVPRRSTTAEPTPPAQPTEPPSVQQAAPRPLEPVEMPTLPTDLFEKNFAAKFNRSRQRLARLRAEISKD